MPRWIGRPGSLLGWVNPHGRDDIVDGSMFPFSRSNGCSEPCLIPPPFPFPILRGISECWEEWSDEGMNSYCASSSSIYLVDWAITLPSEDILIFMGRDTCFFWGGDGGGEGEEEEGKDIWVKADPVNLSVPHLLGGTDRLFHLLGVVVRPVEGWDGQTEFSMTRPIDLSFFSGLVKEDSAPSGALFLLLPLVTCKQTYDPGGGGCFLFFLLSCPA